jgi:hypothetical protein
MVGYLPSFFGPVLSSFSESPFGFYRHRPRRRLRGPTHNRICRAFTERTLLVEDATSFRGLRPIFVVNDSFIPRYAWSSSSVNVKTSSCDLEGGASASSVMALRLCLYLCYVALFGADVTQLRRSGDATAVGGKDALGRDPHWKLLRVVHGGGVLVLLFLCGKVLGLLTAAPIHPAITRNCYASPFSAAYLFSRL